VVLDKLKDGTKTDGSVVDSQMHLFPALDPRYTEVIEKALQKKVPEMLQSIKTINNSINQILNLENSKEFILDSFNAFILNARKYFEAINN